MMKAIRQGKRSQAASLSKGKENKMKTIDINDVKAQAMFDGHPDEGCISFITGDGKPVVWVDDSSDGRGFMTEDGYHAHFTDLNGRDFHACFSYVSEDFMPTGEKLADFSKWEDFANNLLKDFGARLGEHHAEKGGYYDLRRI